MIELFDGWLRIWLHRTRHLNLKPTEKTRYFNLMVMAGRYVFQLSAIERDER